MKGVVIAQRLKTLLSTLTDISYNEGKADSGLHHHHLLWAETNNRRGCCCWQGDTAAFINLSHTHR